MNKMDVLDLIGTFSWGFGDQFFIETEVGNFVWSDPGYNGNNVLRKVSFDHFQGCRKIGIRVSRDKGTHIVGEYCGRSVNIHL